MVAVIGLGNPGDEYRATRHNAGFMVAEEFSRSFDGGRRGGSYRAAEGRVGTISVVVAWPQLFMNNSGPAVADILRDYRATPGDMLILSDDVALPLGTIRIRPGGSHGGHNGLRSIIDTLGTEGFPRLRCGINSDQYGNAADLADFVLAPFGQTELETVQSMIRRAAQAIETYVVSGIDAAMTTFNTQ
jgi:peptidyl-tRNA hydrolase, PTH1 family